jgi:hypothetical protein
VIVFAIVCFAAAIWCFRDKRLKNQVTPFAFGVAGALALMIPPVMLTQPEAGTAVQQGVIFGFNLFAIVWNTGVILLTAGLFLLGRAVALGRVKVKYVLGAVLYGAAAVLLPASSAVLTGLWDTRGQHLTMMPAAEPTGATADLAAALAEGNGPLLIVAVLLAGGALLAALAKSGKAKRPRLPDLGGLDAAAVKRALAGQARRARSAARARL